MSRRVVGREHVCRLSAAPLRDATEWLERYRAFWATKLDALAAEVEEDEERR